MPQFRFNTISRADIERSPGGNVMIHAIDYDGSDNQLVTGVPGSGKTTVTIMRAERLVNQKKTVKVFTFQNLLRTSLKNIATPNLQGVIFGFYEWYKPRFGYLRPEHDETQMIEKMNAEPMVDEILIDEGQDFEARIYRSLLPKCRRMTVGADNAQRIHPRGILSSQIKSELESRKTSIPVRLEYNYRNTYEIYNFARHFMPDNERANNSVSLAQMPRGTGNMPTIIQTVSELDKRQRLKIILENAGVRNIAILLYHQRDVETYYKLVRELGFGCTMHHHYSPAPANIENILITTYKSAKGLEFQVVIMPDMQNAMDSAEKTPEHYYIGCTRAKESLFLMYSGSSLPKYLQGFDKNSYILNTNAVATQSVTPIEPLDELPF